MLQYEHTVGTNPIAPANPCVLGDTQWRLFSLDRRGGGVRWNSNNYKNPYTQEDVGSVGLGVELVGCCVTVSSGVGRNRAMSRGRDSGTPFGSEGGASGSRGMTPGEWDRHGKWWGWS